MLERQLGEKHRLTARVVLTFVTILCHLTRGNLDSLELAALLIRSSCPTTQNSSLGRVPPARPSPAGSRVLSPSLHDYARAGFP